LFSKIGDFNNQLRLKTRNLKSKYNEVTWLQSHMPTQGQEENDLEFIQMNMHFYSRVPSIIPLSRETQLK